MVTVVTVVEVGVMGPDCYGHGHGHVRDSRCWRRILVAEGQVWGAVRGAKKNPLHRHCRCHCRCRRLKRAVRGGQEDREMERALVWGERAQRWLCSP